MQERSINAIKMLLAGIAKFDVAAVETEVGLR